MSFFTILKKPNYPAFCRKHLKFYYILPYSRATIIFTVPIHVSNNIGNNATLLMLD